MYAQCDAESLIDFRRSTTALCYNYQKVTANGRTHYRRSTAGWHLCCQWKDGSTSWCKLADLKKSHHIETAEYAFSQGLDGESAFNWWVLHVIKKRAHIISLVKNRSARYLKKTHKFGVQVPKSAKHALELDKQNSNTFWKDSIAKEMNNVRVAFQMLDENEEVPIGYKFICCHMIFDIKMEDSVASHACWLVAI